MDVYHAYTYGCAFWYFTRGITRLISPTSVISWFRPPIQLVAANDLEIYETKSEAWCLLALTLMVLLISGAAPLRSPILSMPASDTDAGARKYARWVIAVTVFHHVTTGMHAATHWWYPSHNNNAMRVGVYFSAFFAVLGVLAMGSVGGGAIAAGGKKRR